MNLFLRHKQLPNEQTWPLREHGSQSLEQPANDSCDCFPVIDDKEEKENTSSEMCSRTIHFADISTKASF